MTQCQAALRHKYLGNSCTLNNKIITTILLLKEYSLMRGVPSGSSNLKANNDLS